MKYVTGWKIEFRVETNKGYEVHSLDHLNVDPERTAQEIRDWVEDRVLEADLL